MNRRTLLATMAATVTGTLLTKADGLAKVAGADPARTLIFDVRQFGALGDGKTLDTKAINQAIDACAASGGIVYVPPGTYLCGTVVLKSNVTLYLDPNSTILGSTNSDDFTLMPGPPAEGDANQRHLIFARDAANITICGTGTIDGQGAAFWKPREDHVAGEAMVAQFAFIPSTRRSSPLLEFYNCTNLKLQDIRVQNASGWTVRPIQCTGVFIDGITIKNPLHGPNTDGIDPTCCKNVLISNCLIETGDDAICLKSENPYGGDVAVSKNITITNCILSGSCNGLKFGTATYGGYENIVFSNSVIYSDEVPTRERVISGIAIEMVDGGYIEGVSISNIRMQRVRNPIFIRRGARHGGTSDPKNYLRGIVIDQIQASGSLMTSCISGLPDAPIEDVTLSNLHIENEEASTPEMAARRDVPEVPELYPEIFMFGHLPAHGLFARHVRGLRVDRARWTVNPTEARPMIYCEDVNDLELSRLQSSGATNDALSMKFIDSSEVSISQCRLSESKTAFLELLGSRSTDIAVHASDLANAKTIARFGEDAKPTELREWANSKPDR